MGERMRWGSLLALLCMLLMVGTAAGHAAAAAPAPSGIGVVDLEAVSKSYVGYQKATERIKTFAAERKKIIDALQAGLGLTKDEYDEYKRLAGHTVRMNEQRIKELEAAAKKNVDEYQALRAKENQTAEEKARFELLEKQIKTVYATLSDDAKRINGEVEAEFARYQKLLTESVDKSVAKVAGDMKLAIVISKDVQSREGTERVVLWGGTNITDDVVKDLNANFKEAMLDPQR